MSVKITDCTIRDGGYLLNKNSDPEFVKAVLEGLAKAGIDYVETGFLQTVGGGETLVYKDVPEAVRYLPDDRRNTQFIGFCDNSRYDIDSLSDHREGTLKWIRLSFAKHELDDALVFCTGIMNKGYKVQFNPMDAISYTDEERAELIRKVNEVHPDTLSIVDTFGAMYLDDLTGIFRQMDKLLDKDISIGLHSHDNLGLSSALAEVMIRLAEEVDRDISVDGSLLGMGRGAGNAATELIADYLNKKCGAHYDIPALIDVIENYIVPVREKTGWGYDLPMMICGTLHSHVDNVYYLEGRQCSASDMYNIISDIPEAKRARYGRNYSKNDFTEIAGIYDSYMEKRE